VIFTSRCQPAKEQVEKTLQYPELIEALRKGFQEDFIVPKRHHHDFVNSKSKMDSTLLLMPAWQVGKYLGVKIATVSPENGKYDLPAVHGVYTLFEADTGKPLAQIEATSLTNIRTAATSALASDFLSKKNSATLLMGGTGKLAPELIKAHSAIRPIESDFEIFPIKNIEDGIVQADIISCATLSPSPLVFGKNLKDGQHLDLVGAFRPDMREADDEAIRKSSVFVDTYDGKMESGDIFIPIKNGILEEKNIRGDLFELCKKEKEGRVSEHEITFFKSVGHALEDLVAAKLVYEKLKNKPHMAH